jgi:translation initiation factor IF-2
MAPIPKKIYEQLAGMNLLVEEWGGKFLSQELSAKQGLNVDAYLKKYYSKLNYLELKANPNPGRPVVLSLKLL